MEPGVEHYDCMIDLFAFYGLLGKAYDLIIGMKVKPDFVSSLGWVPDAQKFSASRNICTEIF